MLKSIYVKKIAKLSVVSIFASFFIGITPNANATPTDGVSGHINLTIGDLQYILDQIKMAEAHATRTKLTAPTLLNPNGYDKTSCLSASDLTSAATPTFGATGFSRPYTFDPTFPLGLRQVDGMCNNIQATGNYTWGAADQPFRRLYPAVRTGNNYPVALTPTNLTDSEVRNISNIISDQTAPNVSNGLKLGNAAAVAAARGVTPTGTLPTETAVNATTLATTQVLSIANVSPDFGLSAPYNSWFTLFGQFFDHGLDLVPKANSGTAFISLRPTDSLYSTNPANPNFMTLTRSLQTGAGTGESVNLTTPYVDQNQTYTSHPSHQVFLREYVRISGITRATGYLLDGIGSGVGGNPTWKDVKAQALLMLGISLTDADISDVPMVLTDQYGNFIPGPNGYAQMVKTDYTLVEGNASGVTTTGVIKTGHAFLDDIAHNAVPKFSSPGVLNPDNDSSINGLFATLAPAGSYDNELLDSHYITGDGRGNENIGLTAVHQIFHSEHNTVTTDIINLLSDPTTPASFLAEWKNGASWNGNRLFLAARMVAEMEYQHLVFDEFVRRFQPNFVAFNQYNPTLNAAISAEFAQAVYRFGHSMLTETISRSSAAASVYRDAGNNNIGLIQGFLNPPSFTRATNADPNGAPSLTPYQASGSIAMGMTSQRGNEIDEFLTESLRNNLLGLPLDLASLNLARGRDFGLSSLNNLRNSIYAQTGNIALKPYTSWMDYKLGLDKPASLTNFIAAYGTHSSIPKTFAVAKADIVSADAGASNLLTITFSSSAIADKFLVGKENGSVIISGIPNLNSGGTFSGYVETHVSGSSVVVVKVNDPASLTLTNSTIGDVTGTPTLMFMPSAYAQKFAARGLMAATDAKKIVPTGAQTDQDVLTSSLNLNVGDVVLVDRPSPAVAKAYLLELSDSTVIGNWREITIPADAIDFLYSTGAFASPSATANTTGINNVDLWIGGLAERPSRQPVLPGILGSTFDYVFSEQMNVLQSGDRLYYLSRIAGTNLLSEIASQSFARIIRRNTSAQGIPSPVFSTPDCTVDMSVANDTNCQMITVSGVNVYDGMLNGTYLGTAGDDAIRSGNQDDTIWGGLGNDYLDGGRGSDTLDGGPGNDLIMDVGGPDLISGGTGDDVINGGPDADVIDGGTGNDFIFGGDLSSAKLADGQIGNDFVGGSPGADALLGGDGSDWVEGFDGSDALTGGNGQATDLGYNPTSGNDVLLAGAGNDALKADGGDDILVAGNGFDTLQGGPGFDWVTYQDAVDAVDADLSRAAAGVNPLDTFLEVEGLSGWNGNDILTGDSIKTNVFSNLSGILNMPTIPVGMNSNVIFGGKGIDTITGAGGNDYIDGKGWIHVCIRLINGQLPAVGKVPSAVSTDASCGGVAGFKSMNDIAVDLVNRVYTVSQFEVVREYMAGVLPGESDTAVFSGTKSEYTITTAAGVITITDARGIDGTDTLVNIDKLKFADTTVFTAGLPNQTGVVSGGAPAPAPAPMLSLPVKVKPVIEWAKPNAITSDTVIDSKILNAVVKTPTGVLGTFTYNVFSGQTLPVGNQTLTATFTPVDQNTYESVSVSVVIEVRAITRSVVFEIDNLIATYDGLNKPVSVTSNPGGILYTVTYNGSTLAPKDAGTYDVIATSNDSKFPGTITKTLTIKKATPLVIWNLPLLFVAGQSLTSTNLSALSNTEGKFSFTANIGDKLMPGKKSITLTFTPDDQKNYEPVTQVREIVALDPITNLLVGFDNSAYRLSTNLINQIGMNLSAGLSKVVVTVYVAPGKSKVVDKVNSDSRAVSLKNQILKVYPKANIQVISKGSTKIQSCSKYLNKCAVISVK